MPSSSSVADSSLHGTFMTACEQITLSSLPMPLIVDTYNVLHVVGVLPPEEAGIDLPGLIRLIQHGRYRDERVELICDGSPREDVPPGKRGGTIVRYSGATRQADDVIAQMIRASSIPKRLTVVSSDQEVIRAARRRRCRVLASDVFLRQLAHDVQMPVRSPAAAPPEHVNKAQLEAWQRYFDIDDDEVASLEADAERENRARQAKRRAEQKRVEGAKASGDPSKAARPKPSQSGSTQPLFPKELLEEAERLAQQLDRLDERRSRQTDADGEA